MQPPFSQLPGRAGITILDDSLFLSPSTAPGISDPAGVLSGYISDALVSGETVKISSFGTFSVREKGARMGRNPKTGEEVPIEPRRVLVFRPSHILKDKINEG